MKERPKKTAAWYDDRIAAFSLLTPLAGIGIGGICWFMALGGSIVWWFAGCLVNLPLLLAIAGAIFGMVKTSPRFQRRRTFCSFGLLMALPLAVLFGWGPIEVWWKDTFHLLPNPSHGSGTRAEFHFGKVSKTVHDPHDQLRFCWGAPPDRCYVENGVRVLIFESAARTLCSWSADFSVREDLTSYGGWMGVTLSEQEIWIDSSGALDAGKLTPISTPAKAFEVKRLEPTARKKRAANSPEGEEDTSSDEAREKP